MDAIHVCFSTDRGQAYPVAVAIHSILTHFKKNRLLNVCILTDTVECKEFLSHEISRLEMIHSETIFNKDVQVIPEEERKFFENKMRILHKDDRNRESLSSVMNFGRFCLPHVFGNLDKAIYLDSDVIVQSDLSALYDLERKGKPLAACPSTHFDNPHVRKLPNYSPDYVGFNAGVCVIDFKDWRDRSLGIAAKQLMVVHKDEPEGLFMLGTQPIMNILYYRNYTPIPREWNFYFLGWSKAKLEQSQIRQAKILHWSGVHKPWLQDGKYKELWEKYCF